jgi:hypothetical protein
VRAGRIDPTTGVRQRGDWSGGFVRLSPPIWGMTIGAYPWRGVVTIEARLAVMISGDVDDHRLIAADRVADGAARARAAVESLGIALRGSLTISRADLAAELMFADGGQGGVALLNAAQRGLHLPRLTQVPYSAPGGQGRLESIIWQTPKTHQTRVKLYDAGQHHGTHRPGERLRLEREQRWSGAAAPTVEQFMALDLAALYAAPMRPWLNSAVRMRVGVPLAAIAELYEQARRGERTLRSAETLSAKINSLAFGADLLSPLHRRRRNRAVRDAGFALDLCGDDAQLRLIDLQEPVVALVAAWGGPGDGPERAQRHADDASDAE